jgi:glycogen phosphorylase
MNKENPEIQTDYTQEWYHPYTPPTEYSKRVAYFSMEFAIHQPLKIYSGGLGYLAGSHMRSAFELKQNMVGIGMLWKYGYYDQDKRTSRLMETRYLKKFYSFLQPTDIIVPVYIDRHLVYVKAVYLAPEVFGTVPMYFLTTDIPENDYLGRTITHKLYDADMNARIAQMIVLGVGGAKVIDAIGGADIYHLNEAHALPLAFHLYSKFHNLHAVKNKMVFTTHTPEKAGNEEHNIHLLDKLGFFTYLPLEKVRKISGVEGDTFSHTLVALRMSKIANGVSQLHGKVAQEMWNDYIGVCSITAITNAQNAKYWADPLLKKAAEKDDNKALVKRKKELKTELFELVANQTGKIFDPDVLTIVWARRFAEYKRADLLLRDIEQFKALISDKTRPVQIIWAGKPYPMDSGAINMFNNIMTVVEKVKNCAVVVGYELTVSKTLKRGSDIWLNNPRMYREASGTSGMTAAMNGTINLSIPDGWVPEYAEHNVNSFVIPPAENQAGPYQEVNSIECQNLYKVLFEDVLPTYYDRPDKWADMMKKNILTISPQFESGRMADEYYKLIYNH